MNLIIHAAIMMGAYPAVLYGIFNTDTVMKNQEVAKTVQISPAKCGTMDVRSVVYQGRKPVTLSHWKKHPDEPMMDLVTPAIATGFVRFECQQNGDYAVIKMKSNVGKGYSDE